MFELFMSGGWLMLPILGCSIVALAIIAERFLVLQHKKVIPTDLLPTVLHNLNNNNLNNNLEKISQTSVLGEIIAKGLLHREYGPQIMKERMQEAGRHAMLELERFLNFLGTIAAITPLLGLLGTVTGMIQMFGALTLEGGGANAEGMAGGISQALLTTAFGLFVAIPSLMFHRFFHRRIDEFAVGIEGEALKLVDHVKKLDKIR